ncbi:MAG TPA: MFS transporter, partial [Spirochaetota bacterium]|nr:MFS transporter [Spirochaetota bacterium]
MTLLLGLSKGEKEGWFSSYIITCAVMSALGFIGFILVESNTSYGIINLHLFKSPVFSICSIIFLVRSVVLFGGIFLLPLFLQQQMGYDEMQTGLILLPSSIVMAFIMPFSGILGDKIGARLPTIFGLIGLWLFMYMYKNMDVTMSVYDIIFPTLLRGI